MDCLELSFYNRKSLKLLKSIQNITSLHLYLPFCLARSFSDLVFLGCQATPSTQCGLAYNGSLITIESDAGVVVSLCHL